MKVFFNNKINQHPEPEDVGTITITANIIGDEEEDNNLTFTTCDFTQTFIEDDECQSKQGLSCFLIQGGVDEDDCGAALIDLVMYVVDLTFSASDDYSPGCAIEVRFDFTPNYLFDGDDEEEEDSLIGEVIQDSFEETNNIRVRPASKLVVTKLTRKTYKKKSTIKKRNREDMKKISYDIFLGEKCTICLEEFNDGDRVVTLPCGHDFHDDDECIVKWFEISHVCPLCRYELRCED
ncbi:unnamed protein product [Cochlearia groenlandica]